MKYSSSPIGGVRKTASSLLIPLKDDFQPSFFLYSAEEVERWTVGVLDGSNWAEIVHLSHPLFKVVASAADSFLILEFDVTWHNVDLDIYCGKIGKYTYLTWRYTVNPKALILGL